MSTFKLPGGLELPTDLEDLKEILNNVEPRLQPLPSIRHLVSRFVDGADMDEVFPNLWLGDCDAAMNILYLQRHGITHIVNAADNKTGPARVKTGPEYYKDTSFEYLGLDLIDLPFANVVRHFEESSDFIEEALREGGTVLVHCRQGRSRSASIVIGFLMSRRNYTAEKALRRLREIREIRPNNSFLQQIADYDLQLFRKRLEYYKNQLSSSSDSDSTSEVGEKDSLDSGSFKTFFSEPSSELPSEPSLVVLSDATSDQFSNEFSSGSLSHALVSHGFSLFESIEFTESMEFESCMDLPMETSVQLVIDSDYDSDDESSGNEEANVRLNSSTNLARLKPFESTLSS